MRHFFHLLLCTVSMLVPAIAMAADPNESPSAAGIDKSADGTVYYHEQRHVGKDISELVPKLPFAYYPSINKLEAALMVPDELSVDEPLREAKVNVIAVADNRVVAEGTVALGRDGRGQAMIDLPGRYATRMFYVESR